MNMHGFRKFSMTTRHSFYVLLRKKKSLSLHDLENKNARKKGIGNTNKTGLPPVLLLLL